MISINAPAALQAWPPCSHTGSALLWQQICRDLHLTCTSAGSWLAHLHTLPRRARLSAA